MNNLADLLANKKKGLNATTTRVRKRDGTILEEQRDADGNLIITKEGKEPLPSFLEAEETGMSELEGWVFAGGAWEKVKKKGEEVISAPFAAETDSVLRVGTYNVWFAEEDQKMRGEGLLKVLLPFDLDIICFQEVTSLFLSIVKETEWVRENYVLSDASGNTCYPYGVAILAKKASPSSLVRNPSFRIHSLPSNMGRRAVSASFSSGLCVVTAHLESKANSEMRIEQLKDIFFSFLSPSSPKSIPNIHTYLFMGDTNFGDGSAEQTTLQAQLPNLVDVALHLHKPEALSTKTMLDPNDPVGRIDKVYLGSVDGGSPLHKEKRAEGGGWSGRMTPNTIQLVGKEPIGESKGGKPVYPSDHLGLVAKLGVE